MGFLDDFAQGLKDVGTSATRIVTDTAIDIGDLATGFQFTDDMNAAKKTMSDAGVLSAADAIEKNHYPFLKGMQKEAETKLARVQALFAEGQAHEREADRLVATLSDMCADVVELTLEGREAEELLEDARRIPGWERWSTVLDVPPTGLDRLAQVSTARRHWESVGRDIATSGLVVGAADGASALVALGAISKGKKLAKLAKLGRLGGTSGLKSGAQVTKGLAKASKFLKVGKMAGRASGVLAVVTVGLDVGLSVVELEARKGELEDTLSKLDKSIAETTADLSALNRENVALRARTKALLNSVSPPQSESSWPGWVDSVRIELRQVIENLVSASAAIRRAELTAERSRGKPLALRIAKVAAVDPEISEGEAREIIDRLDRAVGKADPVSAAGAGSDTVSTLPWRVTGPGTAPLTPIADADGITFGYGLADGADEASWTAHATAPWTRNLTVRWRYGASHTPADLPGNVVLFADGPDGREFTTLYSGTPRSLGDPTVGEASLQVHAGRVFGVTVSARRPGTDGVRTVCGTYRREPVENDWHVGTIDVQDELGVTLRWSNRAGVSWDLLPHLKAGVLLKTPGSPYQDEYEGSNQFSLITEDGACTGFMFIGERYGRDPTDPSSARADAGPAGNLLGMLVLEFAH